MGMAVDPDFFNSPGSGPHTVDYTCAFKCRPGRTGTGEHPLPIAQDRLTVGAHVQKESKLVGLG